LEDEAWKVKKGVVGQLTQLFLHSINASIIAYDRFDSFFDTFAVSKCSARTGRNPPTGASIKSAASKTARFPPGKELKDSIK
jgi:DNA-binding protein HU-beta